MTQTDVVKALGTTAPGTGQTVGQVILSAVGVAGSAATLKMLIDQQTQIVAKSAATAALPTIAAPDNASEIYAYVAVTTADPNYAAALSALNGVVAGVTANPPTNTWEDFIGALLYLAISAKAGIPNA